MSFNYIIRANTEATEEGRPLFWHNDDGWVELDDATSFSALERLSLNLPIDSEWCIDHRDHTITYNTRGVYAQEFMGISVYGDVIVAPDGELEAVDETFLWCETCGMEVSGLDIGATEWYDVVGEGTGPRVANG